MRSDHRRVDLAHLLAPTGILDRECACKRAAAAANVDDALRAGRAQHDPKPSHVIELEVRGIGEVDIGQVHAIVGGGACRRRAPGIALDDEVAVPGDHGGGAEYP